MYYQSNKKNIKNNFKIMFDYKYIFFEKVIGESDWKKY